MTVFKTPEQLDKLAPEVSKGQRIEQTVLARDLETVVGGAVLVTVTQVPAKKPGAHPAWVWKQVADTGIRNQVVAYAAQRDAAVEAAVAEALTSTDEVAGAGAAVLVAPASRMDERRNPRNAHPWKVPDPALGVGEGAASRRGVRGALQHGLPPSTR